MANPFQTVAVKTPPSNSFDLKHDHKTTFAMGKLIPITLLECYPGDQFNITTETMLRFAPMIAPIMHQVNVFTHYFFVPNRLLWKNWEKFITAANGQDPAEIPAPPFFQYDGPIPVGSLEDYLGLPTGVNLPPVSALPYLAYEKIYSDYYVDQNMVDPNLIYFNYADSVPDGITSGISPSSVKPRAWMHDYFTSALPWPQKGPEVTLPLGTFGDVQVYADGVGVGNSVRSLATGNTVADSDLSVVSGVLQAQTTPISQPVYIEPTNYFAETSSLIAGAASINDLRSAFRLQEWLEKMARGGSRQQEVGLMHFGVRGSDKRLQRAEFLGGSRNPVIISEVLQTSETAETPQGTMAGHGLAASTNKQVKYYCEEWGWIVGIMSVMPKTAYQQGIHRSWSRTSYLDYMWPSFAHLGEQAILNKELYVADDGLNDEVFGYVPRYSELRYMDSRVSGDFRDTMNFWHMGRIFENRPLLNNEFITSNPTNRIFAVTDEEHDRNIWGHIVNHIRVRRRLPKHGTPTL